MRAPSTPPHLLCLLLVLGTAFAQTSPGHTYGSCGTKLMLDPVSGSGSPELVTFNLSSVIVEGQDLSYTSPDPYNPQTFTLALCGMASETCIGETPAVGMGILQGEDSGGKTCNVVGTWDEDLARWSPLLDDGDFIGLTLKGIVGAPTCPAGGPSGTYVPYSMTVNINCYEGEPSEKKKSDKALTEFIAVDDDACNPVFQVSSCLACRDGCGPGRPDGPVGPVKPIPNGINAFGWFCIVVFGMLLPAYVIGGFAYNYQTKGLRGYAALPPPLNRLAGPQDRGPQDWTKPSTAYGSVDTGVDSL